MDAKVRLFVDQPLAEGQAVAVGPDQAAYLFSVMRLEPGEAVTLFNGRDGAWRAEVAEAGKRRGILVCAARTAPQQSPPDLWLLFAPLRKERTNFLVEKAVELGVARLMPVTTRFTNADRWRQDKQLAHAIEAAEQCGATHVPAVEDVRPLAQRLDDWPADRPLFWADEALAGQAAGFAAGGARGGPAALLIGPEGGFAEPEKQQLRSLPFVRPISLGPRILRAETAALAALVLWQQAAGDWQ